MLGRVLSVLGVALAICQAAHARSDADLNAPSLAPMNGKILTLDSRFAVTTALAIPNGKILTVGDSAAIRPIASSGSFWANSWVFGAGRADQGYQGGLTIVGGKIVFQR